MCFKLFSITNITTNSSSELFCKFNGTKKELIDKIVEAFSKEDFLQLMESILDISEDEYIEKDDTIVNRAFISNKFEYSSDLYDVLFKLLSSKIELENCI